MSTLGRREEKKMEHCTRYGTADFAELAAGDLGRAAAWRLRRHLAGCAECHAEAQGMAALFAAARREVPDLPLALTDRTWEAFVAPGAAHHRTRWVPRRVAVGAIGLTAGVAALAAFSLLPGTPVQPIPAFAEVEAATANVSTATWQTKYYRDQWGDGRMAYTIGTEEWVRLSPPATSSRSLPEPGMVMDYDRRVWTPEGWVSYRAKPNKYVVMRTNLRPGDEMRRVIRKSILSSISAPEDRSVEEAQPLRPGGKPLFRFTPWRGDYDTRDGKRLLRFRRRMEPVPLPAGYTPSARVVPSQFTVWADPGTRRVVRTQVDRSTPWPGGGADQERVVTEDYRYNVAPPSGTFDLRPTAGAAVVVKDWRSRPTTLSPTQVAKIQELIDRSDAGWRAGDFDEMASVWDMGYGRPLPNVEKTFRSEAWGRRSWRDTTEHQRGRWASWRSRVEPRAAAVRNLGWEGGFVPESDADILEVKAITRATQAFGKERAEKAWDTTYYLRPDGDGYRIVHWRYRWPFSDGEWFRQIRKQARRSDTAPRPVGRR